MLNYLTYLFECARDPQQDDLRCINILNTIDYMYRELRVKCRVPSYIQDEENFTSYLEESDNIEDYYIYDLPYVCKILLKSHPRLMAMGSKKSRYDQKLLKRCNRIIKFFGFEGVHAIKQGSNEEKRLIMP